MRSVVVSYKYAGGIGIHAGCGPVRANTPGSPFGRRKAVSGLARGLPRTMRARPLPLRHACWRILPASAEQPPRITPVRSNATATHHSTSAGPFQRRSAFPPGSCNGRMPGNATIAPQSHAGAVPLRRRTIRGCDVYGGNEVYCAFELYGGILL